MINKIKNNKFLKIILNTIRTIITIFIVLIISIICIQRISNNKLNLGGFSIYTIVTESMVPKYNVFDMILAKRTNPNDIKIGDAVVYLGREDSFQDKIVTHEVVKIEEKNGIKYFHTKGIANDIEDPLVKEDQILGKVIMKSYILSYISKVVNNPYGFYFIIFVPFAILVSMELIDFIEERKENKK